MRYLSLILTLIIVQGCAEDHCSQLDNKQFLEKEQLIVCDGNRLTDAEMETCVQVRHADIYEFHAQYGIGYNDFLWRFDQYQHLVDDDFISKYGTYILAAAFRLAEPDNHNLVGAIKHLLSRGVDPFKPHKTEIAPVGWLLEGFAIPKSKPETVRLWELVTEYYPPTDSELSHKVDMYIKHCRN